MAILRSATRFDEENWFQMVIDKIVPSCEVTGILDGEPIDFSDGNSAYTLLKSEEFDVSTTSTTEINVGTVVVNTADWKDKGILFAVARDKAGFQANHFGYSFTEVPVYGTSPSISFIACYVSSEGDRLVTYASKSGVYPNSVACNDTDTRFYFKAKYASSGSHMIDGTYVVEVYLMEYPPHGVFHL